jgi:uncharacterized protein YgiM (DUF1202 family)
MRLWLVALMLLGSGGSAVVQNPSRVLSEPKFWSRRVGDVNRGQPVTVLKAVGSWFEVRLGNQQTGFVPRSVFEKKEVELANMDLSSEAPQASEADAANASRGFSNAAHAADVDKAHLQKADAVLASYLTGPKAAKLDATMAKEMGGFVSKGQLGGGSR